MNLLRLAGAIALALTPACALAQHATISAAPAGFAPEMAPVTLAATSTPVTATPPIGTTILPPFAPQLGRGIRIIIKGSWSGQIAVGTSSAANACAAGTINPLTVGGSTWGVFGANANETVDVPTLGDVSPSDRAPVYCVTATITAGTPAVSLRQ